MSEKPVKTSTVDAVLKTSTTKTITVDAVMKKLEEEK